MAERQVPPHQIQQQQDETEVMALFVNIVCIQVQGDTDLSPGESATLLSSAQEAAQRNQVDREDSEVYSDIAAVLGLVVEQVDSALQPFISQLDRIIQRNEPDAMRQAFLRVAENLFRNGITTLNILVLLRFAYILVQRLFLSVKNKMEQHLGREVTKFILLAGAFVFKAFRECRILPWLKENGGWRILLPSFNWGGLAVCAGLFLIGLGLWKMSSGH